MYNSRPTPSARTRLLFGVLIVLLVVGVFAWSQRNNGPATAPAVSATAATTPFSAALIVSGTPGTVQPTVSPVTYRIVSGKASISAVITELYYATDADNWDLSHLGSAAGHLEGTPAMGAGGNFVLAGHVELKDGSQGPFAKINMLAPGDLLTIIGDTTPTPIIRSYLITDVGKTAPTDFAVMRNHGFEELTLITCDDFDSTSRLYKTRVIVHARLVVAPTLTARLTATPIRIVATSAPKVIVITATPKVATPTATPKK